MPAAGGRRRRGLRLGRHDELQGAARPRAAARRQGARRADQLPNGPDKGNASRLTISACQTSPSEATATLTVFGLHDKSTLDIRHGVKLERKGGTWTVTGDAHTRRCQPGHGNQEFSGEKCR